MTSVLDKTITVKYVNPPSPPKKRGTIKTTTDEVYGVFPDKMGLFQVGDTYDIEFKEQAFNGTVLCNITDVRPAEKTTTAAVAAVPQHAPSTATYRPTAPEDAERMFVCATLTALIKAGEVKNDKEQLWHATRTLANIWRHTWGDSATFLASEAGRRNGTGGHRS